MVGLIQAACVAAASPIVHVPAVQQPRSFGHFVGDVLTQRIPLDEAGVYLRPAGLPAADRVGLWFQRLAPHLASDRDGGHWLIIDYQIINSPVLPISVALPALTIAVAANAPIKVDSWRIEISPLMAKPAYANTSLLPVSPDQVPAPMPSGALRRRLVVWCILLAVVLWGWAAWLLRLHLADRRKLPFAKALRKLRQAGGSGNETSVWIYVHDALNETAGRVITEQSLDRLFESTPQLEPLRRELEEFYRQSDARFFAKVPVESTFSPEDLCRKLCRIERRHTDIKTDRLVIRS